MESSSVIQASSEEGQPNVTVPQSQENTENQVHDIIDKLIV